MIGLSGATAIFAYQGYGSAIYFAEEVHEAPRLIARTIMLTLFLAVITEIVPVTAALMGAPDMKALLGVKSPFSYFVETTGGRSLERRHQPQHCDSPSSMPCWRPVMQNGRFFFSTGRDEAWHGYINEAFVRTHPHFNSPWIATLVSGADRDRGLLRRPGRTARAHRHGHRARLRHAVRQRRRRPLAGIVRSCRLSHAAVSAGAHPRARSALLRRLYELARSHDGRPSLAVNAAAIVLSFVYYRLVLARRGAWVLRGPEDA